MNIDRNILIDKNNLNKADFFNDLIAQASSAGLLSQDDIFKIQYECVQILAKIICRYNSDFSSSIRIEEAEALMNSVIYTIGFHLKTLTNINEMIDLLRISRIEDLYIKGKERIYESIRYVKKIYIKIKETKLNINNCYYINTIEKALNRIIKKYDAEYHANEVYCLLDYPIAISVNNYTGIEYIKLYVESLYSENVFCNKFDLRDINELLKKCGNVYDDIPINIYSLVFNNFIGKCIIRSINTGLILTEKEVEAIFESIRNKSLNEIWREIIEDLKVMCNNYNGSNNYYFQYMIANVKLLLRKLIDGNKQNENNVFIINDNTEDVIYYDNPKMSAQKYKLLLHRVISCSEKKRKILLITDNIESVADLIDIMRDANLLEDEVTEIIEKISRNIFAVMYKIFDLGIFGCCDEDDVVARSIENYYNKLNMEDKTFVDAYIAKLKLS